MSKKSNVTVDSVIGELDPARRKLLKRSLLAGGAVALAAPVSALHAQQWESGLGKGKGKGKGQGGWKDPHGVPEIDAVATPLAIALLGGVLAVLRERKSKRKRAPDA